jgi:hypothetical protein
VKKVLLSLTEAKARVLLESCAFIMEVERNRIATFPLESDRTRAEEVYRDLTRKYNAAHEHNAAIIAARKEQKNR